MQATRSLLAWRDDKAYDLKICFQASFSLHFSQRTDLILSHALSFQRRWSQCWTVGLNVPATLCAQRLLHCVPGQLVWLFGLLSPRAGQTWSVEEEYSDGDLLGNLLHSSIFRPVCKLASSINDLVFEVSSVAFFWNFGNLFGLGKKRKKSKGKNFQRVSWDSFFKLLLSTCIATEKA